MTQEKSGATGTVEDLLDQVVVTVVGIEDLAERLRVATYVGDRLQGLQVLMGYRGIRGRTASTLLAQWGPERTAEATGLPVDTLRRMARDWELMNRG